MSAPTPDIDLDVTRSNAFFAVHLIAAPTDDLLRTRVLRREEPHGECVLTISSLVRCGRAVVAIVQTPVWVLLPVPVPG